jgi:hypothetical protein
MRVWQLAELLVVDDMLRGGVSWRFTVGPLLWYASIQQIWLYLLLLTTGTALNRSLTLRACCMRARGSSEIVLAHVTNFHVVWDVRRSTLHLIFLLIADCLQAV